MNTKMFLSIYKWNKAHSYHKQCHKLIVSQVLQLYAKSNYHIRNISVKNLCVFFSSSKMHKRWLSESFKADCKHEEI